ncbi:MAG: acyl-CoA synthetase FdrA [Pelolinea sp.]|nr:acyl-CoA synthetase FdrA [Pelolinea sp.]
MEIRTRVIKGQYHDSVLLMLAAKEIKKVEGVVDAAVLMGTEANKALLKQAGLLTEEAQSASADDLVISVKKDKGVDAILSQIDDYLVNKSPTAAGSLKKELQSIRSAVRSDLKLNFAEISVAGAYAAREARDALANGLHVLLFSDNVSIEDEISLKKYAVSQGLLLMGPGAGTAIINGVGLGFANALPPGPVGIVSAAGTGLQEVSSILARFGVGISQAIGTGGRDLSMNVGGLMAIAGIKALIEDMNTKVIVLISKPADDEVKEKILDVLKTGKKECVICTLGAKFERPQDGNIHFTHTLEECAYKAAAIMGVDLPDFQLFIKNEIKKQQAQAQELRSKLGSGQKFIRGLYSGGTLCYEAQVIWKEMLKEPIFSNAPLDKKNYLKEKNSHQFHTALDLGEEEFTVGRPHPMIDNDLRARYISMAASDPTTAVVVMDVMIGYGAHPDPGLELGDAVKLAKKEADQHGRALLVIACVTGTMDDSQGLAETITKLEKAGVVVCETNAQSARLAGLVVTS